MHSHAVSVHRLVQERGKGTGRKAADAGQEGSRRENSSRCRGFAAREAVLKPSGELSELSRAPCGNRVPVPGQRLQNAGDTLCVMQTGCAKQREIRNSRVC